MFILGFMVINQRAVALNMARIHFCFIILVFKIQMVIFEDQH